MIEINRIEFKATNTNDFEKKTGGQISDFTGGQMGGQINNSKGGSMGGSI